MRTKTGLLISHKMDKTAVIRVDTMKKNIKYQKRYRVSKKYYADDPENAFKNKIGSEVTIYETRPLSKLKRWTLNPPRK